MPGLYLGGIGPQNVGIDLDLLLSGKTTALVSVFLNRLLNQALVAKAGDDRRF